jgi:hypothetical protein
VAFGLINHDWRIKGEGGVGGGPQKARSGFADVFSARNIENDQPSRGTRMLALLQQY